MVFNPKDKLSTTNREMTSEKIGLNHLNIERQDGMTTGYMTANPYLGHTQRESTNNSQIGIAKSTSAIFTQVRYNDKPTAIMPVD